jgi:hypothetical protein
VLVEQGHVGDAVACFEHRERLSHADCSTAEQPMDPLKFPPRRSTFRPSPSEEMNGC